MPTEDRAFEPVRTSRGFSAVLAALTSSVTPTPPGRSRNLRETCARRLSSPFCSKTCLHKWAHKLVPVVSSDLVMDCFELARDIRSLDMRAAPYDLRELGHEPVPIETPEGKAQYAAEQRAFSVRGQALRARLVEAIDRVTDAASTAEA